MKITETTLKLDMQTSLFLSLRGHAEHKPWVCEGAQRRWRGGLEGRALKGPVGHLPGRGWPWTACWPGAPVAAAPPPPASGGAALLRPDLHQLPPHTAYRKERRGWLNNSLLDGIRLFSTQEIKRGAVVIPWSSGGERCFVWQHGLLAGGSLRCQRLERWRLLNVDVTEDDLTSEAWGWPHRWAHTSCVWPTGLNKAASLVASLFWEGGWEGGGSHVSPWFLNSGKQQVGHFQHWHLVSFKATCIVMCVRYLSLCVLWVISDNASCSEESANWELYLLTSPGFLAARDVGVLDVHT